MNEPNLIRLSIGEAAKIFGIDQKTIRRAIKENQVVYVVVRGRYRITFESLLKWSQHRPTVRNKLERQGIGQYVTQWKIRNTLYSPNPKRIQQKTSDEAENEGA